MEIVSGIYVIRNKQNGKVYIGSSQNIRRRALEHKSDLRRGVHDNDYLQKSWRKYGEEAFVFEILELCEVGMLAEREQHWIDTIDSNIVYNIAKHVVGSMRGVKHTDETKALISRLATGRKPSQEARTRMSQAHMGCVISKEARLKSSLTQKGRKRPPELMEKLRLSNLGRKASDATRAKMSAIRQNPSAELRYKFGNGARGKKRTPESVAKMVSKIAQEYIVTSPDGTEIAIKNLNQFCKENHLSTTHMSKVANLKRNHHKGWKCRKVE